MLRRESLVHITGTVFLAVVVALAASQCVKKVPPPALSEEGTPTETPNVTPTPTPTPKNEWDISEIDEELRKKEDAEMLALSRENLKIVYFGYDQYTLTDASQRNLRMNASWLKQNSQYGIILEGHCDERGTEEYNLALGQKRAGAVRSYLTALGIPGGRITLVSYGEERPADPGETEDAWAMNRRVEFKLSRH